MRLRTLRRRAAAEGRRVPIRTVATVAAVGSLVGLTGVAAASGSFGTSQVGTDDGHGVLLPSQQRVTPVGTRHLLTNGRILSSAISPDGTTLAALSWNDFQGFLSIIDVRSGKLLQQIGTGTTADPTLGDGTVAADGPLWSSTGDTLWVPQSGDLLRFAVVGGVVTPKPVATITLADSTVGAYLPSGMALSGDGTKLYVALNGANTLGVVDTTTNALVQQLPVGNAPRQVVLVGSRAFVSDEGGRKPVSGDYTNLSDGTPVVADPSTGGATSGTVSEVDLTGATATRSIPVGLQPSAEHLAADGTLMVANSNDDSISLIDTASGTVVQTVNVNPLPGSTVGSYPNAITMPDAHTVLVSIGRDNAIAEYRYSGIGQPLSYLGLIPTDWYPVAVAYDPAVHRVVVTNDKGIGARGPQSTIAEGPGTQPATGHNTYDDTSSITEFAPQTSTQLEADTAAVFTDNTWDRLLAAQAAQARTSVPVPTAPGQVSPIKHVFLLVKENRTYDQVFGDAGRGNGDPTLTQFGQAITPNQHALASTFGLYDNFYDEGTLSADGHNWLVQADANDYIEKEFGAFYRSYPAQGGDALAYQRDGFIWNAAARAGRSSTAYGEYNNYQTIPTLPSTGKAPTWSEWYHDAQVLSGAASGPLDVPLGSAPTYADIPSLNAIDVHDYPKFNLDIPDQYREAIWQRSFQQEAATGSVANLNLLWVPDDHTSGNTGADPEPIAEVADNDLAVGKIVDTISHSKIWKDSAIFVVEDDPQNGVDHVDGHRSTLQVISPYAARGVVNSTYYTQLNVVRTIEAILGIAPMNQEDRAAVPMTDAFTSKPDLTPFTYLPNEVPLNAGVDPTQAGYQPGAGAAVAPSAALPAAVAHDAVPAAEAPVAAAWARWAAGQHFGGATPIVDYANPRQLNRYDFYTSTGWTRPYPGDHSILTPAEVPGATMPADYLGD